MKTSSSSNPLPEDIAGNIHKDGRNTCLVLTRPLIITGGSASSHRSYNNNISDARRNIRGENYQVIGQKGVSFKIRSTSSDNSTEDMKKSDSELNAVYTNGIQKSRTERMMDSDDEDYDQVLNRASRSLRFPEDNNTKIASSISSSSAKLTTRIPIGSVEKNSEHFVADGQTMTTEISLGENRNCVSSKFGDNLQPTLQEPWPDSPGDTKIFHVGLQSYTCIFCLGNFSTEQDLYVHVQSCNSSIAKIISYKERQCLVCKRKIRSFNLCGLIRHAITCVIDYWEKLSLETMTATTNSKIATEKDEDLNEELEETSNDNEEYYSQTFVNGDPDNDPALCSSRSLRTKTRKRFHSEGHRSQQQQQGHRFSNEQKAILEEAFENVQFPSLDDMSALSNKTELSKDQIKGWFDRKRFFMYQQGTRRYRKQNQFKHLEQTENLNDVSQGPSSSNSSLQKHDDDVPPSSSINMNVVKPRVFSLQATKYMQSALSIKMYPSALDFTIMSEKIGLTVQQIKQWFLNKRRMVPHEIIENELKISQSDEGSKKLHEFFLKTSSITEVPKKPLRENVLKIFQEVFMANPDPHWLVRLKLSKETGMSDQEIQDWFSCARRECDMTTKPSTFSPKKRRTKKYDTFSHDDDEDWDIFMDANESDDNKTESKEAYKPRFVTARQKFSAIKHISLDKFDDMLSKIKPDLTQLLFHYHDADEDFRTILDEESALFSTVFHLNNLFTEHQEKRILGWEEDFTVFMYPEKNQSEWKILVNTFQEKILHSWLPVMMYSLAIEVPLEEAANEIQQLTLTRSQKADMEWKLPQLLAA